MANKLRVNGARDRQVGKPLFPHSTQTGGENVLWKSSDHGCHKKSKKQEVSWRANGRVFQKKGPEKNQAVKEEEREQNAITLYHHLYFAPLTSAICYLFPAVTHTLVWADTPPHILVWAVSGSPNNKLEKDQLNGNDGKGSSNSSGCAGQHTEVLSLRLHCIMMRVVTKHTYFSLVLARAHTHTEHWSQSVKHNEAPWRHGHWLSRSSA